MPEAEKTPQRVDSPNDESMFTLHDGQHPSPIPYGNNQGLAFRNYQKIGFSA